MATGTFDDGGGFQMILETIKDMQENIPAVASRRLVEVMAEGRDLMQSIVHVITGYLRSSIDFTAPIVTTQSIHAEIFALALYAAIEEYRAGNHSFFRPGIEHIKARIPEVVFEDVSNYLQTRSGQRAVSMRR